MGHPVLGRQGWGPPNSGPVIKTQSVGYALTHRQERLFLSLFCTMGLAII